MGSFNKACWRLSKISLLLYNALSFCFYETRRSPDRENVFGQRITVSIKNHE